FLKVISGYFPDAQQDYKLNPQDPMLQDTIEKLEVHIDAIKPVWRTDVAEWFNGLEPDVKALMHPIDAGTAPSGEGWIIQLVCHHYNPYPTSREQRALSESDPRRTDFGPIQFLTDKVLSKLNDPRLRLYGVTHVAVPWMTIEKEWTTEKGKGSNNLASHTVPLLDRAAPPVSSEGGAAGGGGGMMDAMKQMMASGRMGGGPMGAGMMPARGMMDMMRNMGGAEMMPGMGMGMGMGGQAADLKKQMKMLTRTDFLLQFVWKPVKPEEVPKTDE